MSRAKPQDPAAGARADPMVVAGRLYALFEDADGWVDWLNRKGRSEVRDAARTLALEMARAAAGGALGGTVRAGGLVVADAEGVAKVLAPVLERCWGLCRPVLEGRAAEGKRVSLRARIWPRPEAVLSEGAAFGEEDLQVFRLFLFLLDEANAAALRTCARRGCSNLFVDRSRGKIGRFCSAACRSRAFREGG